MALHSTVSFSSFLPIRTLGLLGEPGSDHYAIYRLTYRILERKLEEGS